MDITSAHKNDERLEFIQRYMELGLDTIQPCQEIIDAAGCISWKNRIREEYRDILGAIVL